MNPANAEILEAADELTWLEEQLAAMSRMNREKFLRLQRVEAKYLAEPEERHDAMWRPDVTAEESDRDLMWTPDDSGPQP